MDMPHTEILAPSELLDDLSEVASDVRVVSVYGRAKTFDRLVDFSRLERLWVSGLPHAAAGLLGQLRSLRSLVIHDCRSPSLAPLAGLSDLEFLAICGSSKLRSLAGIGDCRKLRELILFDCCNYGDLSPIEGLTQLEALCLEGGFSKQLRLETLSPIASLTNLRRLRLASLRAADKSLEGLLPLKNLRTVFVAKVFPVGELRRVAAALPAAKGEFLDTYRSG